MNTKDQQALLQAASDTLNREDGMELALGWLRYQALSNLSVFRFEGICQLNLSEENYNKKVDQFVLEGIRNGK